MKNFIKNLFLFLSCIFLLVCIFWDKIFFQDNNYALTTIYSVNILFNEVLKILIFYSISILINKITLFLYYNHKKHSYIVIFLSIIDVFIFTKIIGLALFCEGIIFYLKDY